MAKMNSENLSTLTPSLSKLKAVSQSNLLVKKNPIGSKSPGKIEKKLCSEISFKDFLNFLRTAYQINESIEGSNITDVDVNWKDIATNKLVASLLGINGNAIKVASEQTKLQHVRDDAKKEISEVETGNNCVSLKKAESTGFEKTRYTRKDLLSELPTKNILDSSKSMEHLMKRKLNEVIQEGLLDSVLPYVVPKQNIALHPTKKPTVDIKKVSTLGDKVKLQNSKEKLNTGTRRKSSSSCEVEVEIHVCDEVKNLKRDFKCSQKLLVSKMGYFAEVTTGQKLEDMDISVHCDITIFDWLMRWVKKDSLPVESWPLLDAANVVPILVSAAFLQMDPLMQDCLEFCRGHMNEIIKTSTNLSCLNDSILTRLANLFSNSDLEKLRDKKDKIQSRLYCKMIVALTETSPEPARGHFASLASLYRCSICKKLVLRQLASRITCQPSSTKMDRLGNVHGNHTRDQTWNLNDYIRGLRNNLKTWRAVYWHLWGDCHFMYCSQCHNHFPVHQMKWCCHHADLPQFFTMENQRSMTFPIGRYPCCGERAYRFEVLKNESGCQFKDHVPLVTSERDFAVHRLFFQNQDLLVLDPPKLMFPERVTRLINGRAEGDKNAGAGSDGVRLLPREMLWWEGLELAPPRPRYGLLSRIWEQHQKKEEQQRLANSGIKQPAAARLSKRQASVMDVPIPSDNFTDVITRVSTDDDSSNSNSNSNSGSDNSEESGNARVRVMTKPRRAEKSKYVTVVQSRSDGSRQWVPKLSIRSNQDNQREYEERAVRQMAQLLTRRTCADPSNLYARSTKSHGHHHNSTWSNHIVPIGGTYVRLEQEWKDANCHSHGCHGGVPNRQQSLISSTSARPKLRGHR